MACTVQISSSSPISPFGGGFHHVLSPNLLEKGISTPHPTKARSRTKEGPEYTGVYLEGYPAKGSSTLPANVISSHAKSSDKPSVCPAVFIQLERLVNDMDVLSSTLKKVEYDKINLRKVGADIDSIVSFALTHAHEAEKHYTPQQIEHLNTVITSVDKFATKYSRRGWLGRYFYRKSDLKTLSATENQLNALCSMDPPRSRRSNPLIVSVAVTQWDT